MHNNTEHDYGQQYDYINYFNPEFTEKFRKDPFNAHNDITTNTIIPEWANILEVHPSGTVDEIKSAYRKKIKEFHPDKKHYLTSEQKEEAEEYVKIINRAYEEALSQLSQF